MNRAYYVQRAIGVIAADGVVHWTVASVVLDRRGRESQYDACRACQGNPSTCLFCTRASCRACLAEGAVLTDRSFCLPRCR